MSLPVSADPLPSSVTFGKVVGRIVHAIADTAEDTDDKPQARSAAGKVKFTPKVTLRKTTDADYPAIVTYGAQEANLSSTGRILDAEGRQGVWLTVGVWTVSFELNAVGGARPTVPAFDIEVLSTYDDATPLDLATVMPYVPPPSGVLVQTVAIPAGGGTGQVLTADGSGGVVWADAAGGYEPPVGGIPEADLAAAVQTKLNAADVDQVARDAAAAAQATADAAQPAGSYATAAQGALADTAVQPADLEPYATDTDLATGLAGKADTGHTHAGTGGAVDSVNGQTGAVVLDAADVGAATAGQGSLADTALQPGDLSGMADLEDIAALQATLPGARYWTGTGGVGSWSARPSGYAYVVAYSDGTGTSDRDADAPAPPDDVDGDRWADVDA